jgi:hypothetical protein
LVVPPPQLVRLQPLRAIEHVLAQLRLVELRLHRAPVVVISRIAAQGRQPIGREREESVHRRAPSHVLDVRIQPAVLVDHQHRRPRPVPRRLHQIAAHLLAVPAGRGISHIARLDPAVGEGDGLRPGVIGQQALRHHQRGGAQRAGPPCEFAPVDAAVAVLVVQIEDLLVDFELGNRRHCCSGMDSMDATPRRVNNGSPW